MPRMGMHMARTLIFALKISMQISKWKIVDITHTFDDTDIKMG